MSGQPSYTTIKMQYIGAVALLGRLSGQGTLHQEDNDAVAQAMEDLVALYPNDFEIWNTSNGGYSLEPKRGA